MRLVENTTSKREEVVKAMKCIKNEECQEVSQCKARGCPYAGTDCITEFIPDALKLLGESSEDFDDEEEGQDNKPGIILPPTVALRKRIQELAGCIERNIGMNNDLTSIKNWAKEIVGQIEIIETIYGGVNK